MAKKQVKKTAKPAKKVVKEPKVEVPATPESKIAEISKEVSVVQKKGAEMVVNSEESYAVATDFLLGVKGRLKRIEELRVFFVKPLRDLAKKYDAMFAEQSVPLERIETAIKRSMGDYRLEQDRAAQKEEARLAALREKQDERREEKGLAPIATPLPTIARPQSTVQGVGGAATTMKVWKFEVVNIDDVPRHLLRCEVAHSKVQAQIDAGARDIAGLRIYEDVVVKASAR